MIGIRQNDARVQVHIQFARAQAFDRTLRSHRHEHWRFNHAMRGMQQAGPSARLRTRRLYFKSQRRHWLYFIAPLAYRPFFR